MAACYRVHNDGVDLYIRLTPEAHMDVIEGVETTADGKRHLKARVRAVPEKGKANKALEKLIARHFGFAKSSIKVTAGSTSRLKTVTIEGESEEVRRKLML